MGGTTVPNPTLGPSGYIAPDEPTVILPAVQSDLNAAFGGGLNPSLETPQGQLATTIAALVGNVNDTFLWYTQQSDPAYATGRMQDAIARIYFIERIGAQATVVTGTCSGGTAVLIPAGSIALAADGNIYVSLSDATIPASGSIDVQFACASLGPVTCPAGSLNQIYRAIPGWDSVVNAADGVIGRDTETRAQFEARRYASVAKNAVGFLPAVQGAVLGVAGVLDAYVTENYTGSPITVGGVTISAHSLYVCVSGGASADVAQAIWTKKAPGCDMTGNTTVTVYDTANYDPPYPSYSITYEVPTSLPIIFAVNIANSAQVPSDAQAQIAAAIISAFSGADGGPRVRIGSTIYASRFYGSVASLGAWAQIISLQIGSTNSAVAQFTASIAGSVLTVTAVASGALAVGHVVVGAGVADGSVIASLGTGSGGTGTYNLITTQTVASETMYGVVGGLNSIATNINQAPTIGANNVVVTLT